MGQFYKASVKSKMSQQFNLTNKGKLMMVEFNISFVQSH